MRTGIVQVQPNKSTEYTLRQIESKDWKAILRIERNEFDPDQQLSKLELYNLLRHQNVIGVVASEGNKIAGFALLGAEQIGENQKLGHILDICVAECARNNGTGKRMLNDLMTQGRALNIHDYYLEVEESSPAAKLYTQLGFKDVRRIDNCYGEGKHGRLMIQPKPQSSLDELTSLILEVRPHVRKYYFYGIPIRL